jgi:4-amino-4-deoxy-L-arabinose transferase-like glycosyltransferase
MSAVFMGLACLSKGPIGIVFPVCVCALFLLCRGELSSMLCRAELPYLEGTLAILLINLPWYGFMVSKHGLLYLSTFFGYHNLERFVRGVNHHWGRPWWYGMAVVVVMYLPWSLSLPPALVQANPWNPTWRKAERWQTLPLFAATWFAAGFGIFALSSTQVCTTPSVSSALSSDTIVYVCAL